MAGPTSASFSCGTDVLHPFPGAFTSSLVNSGSFAPGQPNNVRPTVMRIRRWPLAPMSCPQCLPYLSFRTGGYLRPVVPSRDCSGRRKPLYRESILTPTHPAPIHLKTYKAVIPQEPGRMRSLLSAAVKSVGTIARKYRYANCLGGQE